MKRALLGALVGAGLVMLAAAWNQPTAVFAQRPSPYGQANAEGSVIALSAPAADNASQVTVIDPRSRAMAVYRVDSASGKIKLLSVRNINWDLQLMQLNSESPLPQEIRSLIEQR